jgi:nitrite reductase (NADH) small subunit
MEALSMQSAGWLPLGPVEHIPRQGARTVRTAFGVIAVFRTLEGQLFALENRCPHKAGPLAEGIVHGCKVACPLHGMNIDLESGTAVAPDEGQVTRYPVKLVDGQVHLGLTPL